MAALYLRLSGSCVERILDKAVAISGVDEPVRSDQSIDIDDHIPALCLILGGKVGLHAKRMSAQQLGLDLGEWRIIQVLGADGRSTIFEIADRIAMDRGGTSRSITHLEKHGVVKRVEDPQDRRRSLISLTKDGWTLHSEIVRFARSREERLLRHLTPADSAHLRKLLRTLINEADDMMAEGWAP